MDDLFEKLFASGNSYWLTRFPHIEGFSSTINGQIVDHQSLTRVAVLHVR